MPVDADKGDGRVHFQVGVVGQGDDAVHLVLPDHVQAALFGLPVVIRDGDDGPVLPPHQNADHGVGQVRKEGVAQRRPDERDGAGLVGLEAAGITVDAVAQLAGGVQHLPAGFGPDGQVVEHLRYGAEGDPGFGGHIFHSGRGACLVAHKDSL